MYTFTQTPSLVILDFNCLASFLFITTCVHPPLVYCDYYKRFHPCTVPSTCEWIFLSIFKNTWHYLKVLQVLKQSTHFTHGGKHYHHTKDTGKTHSYTIHKIFSHTFCILRFSINIINYEPSWGPRNQVNEWNLPTSNMQPTKSSWILSSDKIMFQLVNWLQFVQIWTWCVHLFNYWVSNAYGYLYISYWC
jgi:hypothetical protein